MKPSFPSIGEVVKAILDCSGIIVGSLEGKSGGNRKRQQKMLSRLAKEEGDLNGNLNAIFELVREYLKLYLTDPKVIDTIMLCFEELVGEYRRVQATEGTYLSKKDTIRWLIKARFIDIFVYSLHRNSHFYNVSSLSLNLPSGAWWLPSSNESPLTKAWSWIYRTFDLSQTKFHDPSLSLTEEAKLPPKLHSHRRKQNLENAQRWTSSKALPSLSGLITNLEQSIEVHRLVSGIHVSKVERESYLLVLMIARLSTAAFGRINDAYGIEFSKTLSKHFYGQDRRLKEELSYFVKNVQKQIIDKNIIELDDQGWVWKNETDSFWRCRASWVKSGVAELKLMHRQYGQQFSTNEWIRASCNKITPFVTFSEIQATKETNKNVPPDNFFEMMEDGFKLKNRVNSKKDIAIYATKISDMSLSPYLGWLVDWCYATWHYSLEQDDLAYPFYKSAYESARYSVGQSHYALVNQYIESCAKTGKRREFNKAVAWACYLGLKVRWIRDDYFDDQKNAIEFGYQMFSRTNARYAII
ncbi:hypothetical protein [Vibrio splendidus]|uniref:hypothetical protein n=1 Tax=Vibrio splendidus TaxID=29497 RepID=UPI0002D73D7A|nr:hypothetical protein [Vibrio splendidus]OEF39704.1 hypothetical protein A150_17090 [Vibrio splendidus 1S-124]PTQ17924.1 hypothetical protein CWO14_17595 [Vibrio splendidus]